MNELLLKDGWIHPADPGPSRAIKAVVVCLSLCCALVWCALVLRPAIVFGKRQAAQTVDVAVSGDGLITINGSNRPTSIRSRGGVNLLISEGRGPNNGRRVKVNVSTPEGIDADSVAVRVLQPWNGDNRARLLVTIPSSLLDVKAPADIKPLIDKTNPFDLLVAKEHDDYRRLLTLRDYWWLAAILMIIVAAIPMMLWRRAARRFTSMRVPGPGKDPSLAPPSNLDPVSASIMVGGAGTIDFRNAFAAHVLDLVERKQLPMRRSISTALGAGVLIGLHRMDQVEDLSIDLLSALTEDDELTVILPDRIDRVRRFEAGERKIWLEHLRARANFERLVDGPSFRVLRLALVVSVAMFLVSMVLTLLAPGVGALATWSWFTLCSFIVMVVLGLWLRDVLTWRVVARNRRTERAQWLAWRDLAESSPELSADDRNIPLLVATSSSLSNIRSVASAQAVDLACVTVRSIEALRMMWELTDDDTQQP